MYSYTVGFAIEEQAVYPRPGEPDEHYEREHRRTRIDPATQPTVAALNEQFPMSAIDSAFERGLRILLSRLETELRAARERPGTPSGAAT
ncbi:MAG: TetR/AcrR family transcriptional regulator C-terminal domain-containing protein [Sciscionella sp.]